MTAKQDAANNVIPQKIDKQQPAPVLPVQVVNNPPVLTTQNSSNANQVQVQSNPSISVSDAAVDHPVVDISNWTIPQIP